MLMKQNDQVDLATDWDEYLKTRRINAYTDREFIAPFLNGDLLEVGCGFGDFGHWCALEHACHVTGIDPSGEAIEYAKKMYPEQQWDIGSAEKLPYPDNTFDVVLSLEVIEHVIDPLLFLTEAFRALRAGGVLIVQTPNYPVKRFYDFVYWLLRRKEFLNDDPTHISPMSSFQLYSFAQRAGFDVIHCIGRNILGELHVSVLKKWKRLFFGKCFAQKTILIAIKRK